MATAKRPKLPSHQKNDDGMTDPYIVFTLVRQNSQRTNDETVGRQVDEIMSGTLAGDRAMWEVDDIEKHAPTQQGEYWYFRYVVTITRKKGRKQNNALSLSSEKHHIMDVLKQKCGVSKFGKYPWEVTDHAVSWEETPNITGDSIEEFSINDVVDFNQAKTWDDIEIPEVLLKGTDSEIERHPAFKGIFGRAAHIRVIFSSIKTMVDTKGMRRNHCLLWGLPACAKSHLMLGVQEVLGKGGYLAINGNSATKAGIERIFLDRLKQTGTPPVVFIEEIEKTLEAILTVWLSILDDRAEVRKITHHDQHKAEARVLVIGTANDKVLFDRLMGGRPRHPGAISSRFTKKLYVPRPDEQIMRKILSRDIKLYGGDMVWVDSCIDIMRELGTNDPRTVLSLLDGQDRLLTGEYKKDILAIHQLEQTDRAADEEEFEVPE